MERFSLSSEEFSKDFNDDDTSSTVSEATIREQVDIFEMITKINKRLVKEEECLVRLHANFSKYDKSKTDRLIPGRKWHRARVICSTTA